MKVNKKFLTAFSAFALMLLASIFCMNVFAEADNDAQLLVDSAAPAVSGCDLKKDELHIVKVDMAKFKMLVPEGVVLTVDSDPESFANSEFDRQTLISENVFFYFNTNKTNYCQVYAGMVEQSPLDRYYGDYSSLTKAQQDELLAQQLSSGDQGTTGSFEKINGRTYMLITKNSNDSDTGNYTVYGLYTVIRGYKYIVQVVVVNPVKEDLAVVNEMLNSIKLGGVGEDVSAVEKALIACCVVLLLAVAFGAFVLYRMHLFVKTGTALTSVFGFDMPAAVASGEESDEEDDFDDDEAFEDEADDAAEESGADADADSEKIIDE